MKPDGLPEMSPCILGIPMDKVAHFIMFFPFPILSYQAFMPDTPKKGVHLLVLLVLFTAGLGLAAGTEQIQGLLGYRSEDVKDFYADFIGISSSTVLTMVYILIKRD